MPTSGLPKALCVFAPRFVEASGEVPLDLFISEDLDDRWSLVGVSGRPVSAPNIRALRTVCAGNGVDNAVVRSPGDEIDVALTQFGVFQDSDGVLIKCVSNPLGIGCKECPFGEATVDQAHCEISQVNQSEKVPL